MKRNIAIAFASLSILLGLITPAVSSASTNHHGASQAASSTFWATAPAGTVAGPYPAHDNAALSGDVNGWLNDSGSQCTSSTPVLAWFEDTGAPNMQLYFIGQGSGVWTIHFKSCGNSYCLWQYGFGGSYNNLYMHQCNGSANNDLWDINQPSTYVTYFINVGDRSYVTGHPPNSQVTSQAYAGGWSTWTLCACML